MTEALLTGEDVIRLLRLDDGGVNARERLRHLRRRRLLPFVRLSRTLILYRAEDVKGFIDQRLEKARES